VRDPYFYVSGLLDLPQAADAEERRGLFRQSMAALARAAVSEGAGVLAGLEPSAIARGVQAALGAGLFDELDWLTQAAAGVALYDLASALPSGQEQRELGRRVLARLQGGNAETVALMTARMAQAAAKSLAGVSVRTRIALVMDLPLSYGISDGPLALALVGRRELALEWIDRASIGSLPQRRLAARILERAAQEAARRAASGDAHAIRAFRADSVAPAFSRLLVDRESLAWRHVAIARGLLAGFVDGGLAELEAGLDPKLGPTEWRRAATSLIAASSALPELSQKYLGPLLDLCERDPGVGSAMLWGLGRLALVDVNEARDVLSRLLALGQVDRLLEGLAELRRDYGAEAFLKDFGGPVHQALDALEVRADDAATHGLLEHLRHRVLDDQPGSLSARIDAATNAFVRQGPSEAFAAVKDLVERLQVNAQVESPASRSLAHDVSRLCDLHEALLQSNILAELGRLGTTPGEVRKLDERLSALRNDMATWLLQEAKDASPGLVLQRLRAILHLADGDVGDADDAARQTTQRLKRIVRALLAQRRTTFRDASARRAFLAALARTVDALVRIDNLDVSDVFLLLTTELRDPAELETLAEASMLPDLERMLGRYAAFLRKALPSGARAERPDSMLPTAVSLSPSQTKELLSEFEVMAEGLISDASARSEALRLVMRRLHAAWVSVLGATSLRDATQAHTGGLALLDGALAGAWQLMYSARIVFDVGMEGIRPEPLHDHVAKVLASGDVLAEGDLVAFVRRAQRALPAGLDQVLMPVLLRMLELPREAGAGLVAREQLAPLPPWVPARRTLGGFFLLRPLGAGASGSVFLVNRLEERHEADAERFALKVPDYSETAARSLSEVEFHQLFREEAAALIGLPAHTNLAKFVTFDLAARPKPILVMEFVTGETLEQKVAARSLTIDQAFTLLDGILGGMAAMHKAGIAHLDIKPSNVVIREGDVPVLVDFGLSGRKIRPGCATGAYGAPEVWTASEGDGQSPLPADMYSFGCLAFEVLTGQLLFDADSEVAMVAKHLAHDGSPPPLRGLAQVPGCEALAEILFSALRRAPQSRASAASVRDDLRKCHKRLSGAAWPLGL
jgi:hypothetical protein